MQARWNGYKRNGTDSLELLQKDIGKNGKARVKTDDCKSRKNVRQQLSAVKSNASPSITLTLADHLSASFHGHWMSYRPVDDPHGSFDGPASCDAHHVEAQRAHSRNEHDEQ